MQDSVLRKNIIALLEGGQAYVTVRKSLAGIKAKNRNVRPRPEVRSVWEQLEHMRIAQEDILRYTLDPKWKSPQWPEGYWPDSKKRLTDALWTAATKDFFADLKELMNLVRNPRTDLTAEIPHGEGRTYLRQVLLTADHNAYHTGQIVAIRKMLGDWPD
ncbi:MAG: DinB family protein [Acidobacteriia bacterium]|nr:DinB family protein [Terriglobia bacterium]